MFIDLSHAIEDGMPGFRMAQPDGGVIEFSARIRPFLTHEQSAPLYGGQAAFEITEMTLQTSVGTYLDSPFHRHPERRDIGALRLDETILPGIVIDARGREPWEAVDEAVLPSGVDLAGHAVLFNFGWDVHWGSEWYRSYPFIGAGLVTRLLDAGAALVGVDTLNVDDARDPRRPTHTRLLARDVLIVENLRGLDQLHGRPFRFFAVPWKAHGVAALPIRAFAETQQ